MVSREERGYAPDYVSAETLAYRLDCSRSTIEMYVKKGLLPKPFVLGNLVRWRFADVRDVLDAAANGNAPTEEDDFMKGLHDGAPEKATR